MNLPRKPVDPLPPRDGELARVRRRALVRRLRLPGAAAGATVLAVLAFTNLATTPRPADPIEITDATPSSSPDAGTPEPTTASPSASPSVSPSPSPSATRAPDPSPATSAPDVTPSPASELSGIVLDGAGRPISGVLVHAEGADGSGDGGLHLRLVARTGTDGRWSLPCGTRRLVLSSFEFYRAVSTTAGAYHYAVIREFRCGQPLTTRLGPGGSITGQLVDAAGNPVRESRSIELFCPEDGSTSCLLLKTDVEGRYAFHGLHSGTYSVGTAGTTVHGVQAREGETTTYDPVVSPSPSPSP